MAVLEIATNHYYKINFDKCAVRGLKVFVDYSIYQSVDEREKEKQRQDKWAVFFQSLRQNIEDIHKDIMLTLEANNFTPEEVLSQDEEDMIDGVRYPELRAKQDNMNTLEYYEKEINERLFKYGDENIQPLEIPSDIKAMLENLGYQSQWIDSPIVFQGGGEIYTGDYNGEEITYEFFYQRLKGVMGETKDC